MSAPFVDGKARLDAAPLHGPFCLGDDFAYRHWRDRKLRNLPTCADDLVVEVRDPLALSAAERDAMAHRIRCAGIAIYRGPVGTSARVARRLAEQFGMQQLDRNWLATDDGVSRICVGGGGGRGDYIPYTNRPLSWHTDGYYNPPRRRIRGLVLHCVQDALSGGENAFLDHEIAYIRIRDESPAAIRALMAADALTIPERVDEHGIARPAQTGPVFFVDGDSGALQMRYTARTRSVQWRNDADTDAAAAVIERLLAQRGPGLFRVRLSPGMGLIANNILHNRSGFDDDPAKPRLILRARYLDAPAVRCTANGRHVEKGTGDVGIAGGN